MQSFFDRFLPFLFIGIAIVVGIIGILLLSYVLIWGALVACILYLISWVRGKFFQKSKSTAVKGRTIDHE